MTIEEFKEMIETYGRTNHIPVSFNAFKGRPDASTMLLWENPYDDDFYAENENYVRIAHVVVSLLQADRDMQIEMDFESTLKENRLTFALTNSEYYDDEALWETTYEIEVFKDYGEQSEVRT